MLVCGSYKQAQIARELKISEQTICNWKNKDEEFAAELSKHLRISLKTLVPKAVKTIEDLLESESDNVRLSAAKDILDRTGFKPSDNINVNGTIVAEQSKLDDLIKQMSEDE